MKQILLVTSSPRGAASYSSKVAHALIDKLRADAPTATVAVRDLAREPLPHIDEGFATGRVQPADGLSAAQRVALARSDAVVQEFLAADVIVIASAMINFGVSSTLKAWVDHLARPGLTFRYSEKGPEGLAKGKKVYLVQARGGVYSDGPAKALDFQEPYLRGVLGFLGVTDVETILVEGVAFGPEAAEKAVNAALDRIPTLLAKAA